MKRVVFVMVFIFIFSTALWAQQAGTDQAPGQQKQMQHGQMGDGMKGHDMKGDGMQGDMKCGMMGGMKCGMMGDGQGMQMGMMQGMMGHGMKMQEMLHMMKDMMKIQQRMLTKISDSERKQMAQELSRMLERVDKMLTDMQSMPMKGMMGMPPAESAKPKAEPKKKDDAQKSSPHKHH
jgi:hypothetical protein